MKRYRVQITAKALEDMGSIYAYISEELKSPETAMAQYNRLADAIETLGILPERFRLVEMNEFDAKLRQMPVDRFSVFFHVRNERVIVTNVLYSASDIVTRLR